MMETRIAALEEELAGYRQKPVPTGLSTSGFGTYVTPRYPVVTYNALWRELEPTRGNRTLAPIQRAIDAAAGKPLRIRPFFGLEGSPAWAKELGDGPIPYLEPQGGQSGTGCDVWEDDYWAAITELEAWMATEEGLDDNPAVSLVFATGGMFAFGEPLIRGIGSPDNRRNILAAGYSRELDQQVQRRQLDVMRPWRRTLVGLAYNPLQFVSASGQGGTDMAETGRIMDHHRALFGPRAVLTNHSIRARYEAEPPPLYELFRQRGGLCQFQTSMAALIAERTTLSEHDALVQTIRWAAGYLGASLVETWAGAWNTLSAAEIASLGAELGANT